MGHESTNFIQRTNDDYAAWCKTYYCAETLDERGFMSLHGLWAWQEQERRIEVERDRLRRALWEWRHLGYSAARDADTDALLNGWSPGPNATNSRAT